jgi:hypothetical protein
MRIIQDIRRCTEILVRLFYKTVPKNASNCNGTSPENHFEEGKWNNTEGTGTMKVLLPTL